MLVWRICAREHARRAFRGEGARLYGGRWNPPGLSVVYCFGNLSLACLEVFVHVDPEDAPDDLVAISAEIPEPIKQLRVEVARLPANWRTYPGPESLQVIGANWIGDGESAVLSVPSTIIPLERNYLLNPLHPECRAIVIRKPEPFFFDQRLRKAKKSVPQEPSRTYVNGSRIWDSGLVTCRTGLGCFEAGSWRGPFPGGADRPWRRRGGGR